MVSAARPYTKKRKGKDNTMEKPAKRKSTGKRQKLLMKAKIALTKAGLNPSEIWSARLSIDEILLQPALSDRDAEAAARAIEADPLGSVHRMANGLNWGIMNHWDVAATSTAQELAAETRVGTR
jgi:hypothetical protein